MPAARLALLGASALLAGCGESRSPEEVARGYIGGTDAGRCDDASQAFLERASGRRGSAARDACRRAAESLSPPGAVRVRRTSERGDRAQVSLVADGQEVLVRLERSGDRWLVTDLGP